jgi:16S rRNA (adenine1518-N6/adenine1519-N6)-dimethyltransferase
MSQKLGQHFLRNKSVLEKITQSLDLENGDFVVEIGPGHGELTKVIVEKFKILKCKNYKIVAIEKDKNLTQKFKKENIKNLEIIEGDALKTIPRLFAKHKMQNIGYKIVGNIPYYITGHLLRIIGELEHKPSKTILLIQKEVAQRICAKPPHSSLLSLSVRFWADCKIIEHVSKKYFSPPPKVDSVVIELITKNDVNWENASKYYSFLKKAFKQPRKTLLNNLAFFGPDKKETSKIIGKFLFNNKARPQELSHKDAENLSLLF